MRFSPSRIVLAGCLLLAAPGLSLPGVGPPPRTDAELERAVEKRLERDPALARLGLRAEARHGLLRLHGRVPTLAVRREAVRLAATQRGVLGIESDLIIHSRETSDRALKIRLDRRLSPYADLRSPRLSLTVLEGSVAMAGRVGTIGRKLFLEKQIEQVNGVLAVDLSEVGVQSLETEPLDDERLQEVILSLLWSRELFPVSGEIEVEVNASEVRLTGQVPRLIDRLEALAVARRVPGVAAVTDDLQIDPQMGLSRVRKPNEPH
jgi:osmotically-inducible protein OsmY